MLLTKPLRLSDIAERLLYLDGEPFSLRDYPMYRSIYDGRYRSTLLMCGRQVAKSTSLANFIISESVALPFFKSYYVSPSKEQTLIFSNTRVGKTLSYSPLINKYYQSPEHADRVLHRSYTNGSENAFTYACDDADRARGFSANRVLYDEFQDMLYDAVVPVINACMKNQEIRFETYAGTPKTMEASIQYLWDQSSQSEWVMKCSGCAKYNCVTSVKSLGLHGPICLNCGKGLNPREGFWVDMRKSTPDDKSWVKGFHIPSPIMPANIALCYPNDTKKQENAQERWDEILLDMRRYSESRFKNETLGLSDAQGRRLISLDELQRLCVGKPVNKAPSSNLNFRNIKFTCAGIDWSGGGTSGVSRTVLWIWGFDAVKQKLKTLYYRIYPGNNAVQDVEDIIRLLEDYNVQLVVGDAGEGALANSMVRNARGHHRATMVQYGGQKEPLKWNDQDRWMADRTTLIDSFLMELKQERVEYPPYETIKEPCQDILNVYEEVTMSGKKVWRHSPTLSDDCLHAQLFGWLAKKLILSDYRFYN